MELFKLMQNTTASVTLTAKGRDLLISHVSYLKSSSNSRVVQVLESNARPHYYNFYAYLHSMSIDVNLHWITMIINDLNSPRDFNECVKSLIIPSSSEVDQILSMANL